MPNYTAGNLDIKLSSFGKDSTIKSLDEVITRLTTLTGVLSKLTDANIVKGFRTITNSISKMSETIQAVDFSNFEKVVAGFITLYANVAPLTAINSDGITTFTRRIVNMSTKLNQIDFGELENAFARLTTAVTPFINKIVEAQDGLIALSKLMPSFSTMTKEAKKPEESASDLKPIRLYAILSTIRRVISFGRRLGSAMRKLIEYGSNYVETLNMWQVAFRQNIAQADAFINRMHRLYGISSETLMKTQAVYKNMLSQMSLISDESAAKLSETVTEMTLDFASLWNTTIEQAAEKFQAMLSGQIRPIRSVSGIAVEENAIYQYYKALGGTKTQRQLTQVEKRLLRIYATFRQMGESGAIGDYARTINNWANQTRVMQETWKELVTWLGIGVKEFLEMNGILTTINAHLIAASEIIKAWVMSNPNHKNDVLSGFVETTEEANEEVDELQGKLLDFDKFRALDNNQNALGISVDDKIINALSNYSSTIQNITTDAQKLAETWLESWGFIRDENGDLIATSNTFLKVANSIALAKAAFAGFISTLILFASINATISVIKFLEDFSFKSMSTVGRIGLLVIGLELLIYAITQINAAWGNMNNWEKAIATIASVAAVLSLVIAAEGAILQNWTLFAIGTGLLALATATAVGISHFANKRQREVESVSRETNYNESRQAQSNAVENITVNIDGEAVFSAVTKTAAKNGYTFSKV